MERGGTKDAIKLDDWEGQQGSERWLCWGGFNEDDAMVIGVRGTGILLQIIQVAIIVASNEKDLLALDGAMEMIQHFWSVSSYIIPRYRQGRATHSSSSNLHFLCPVPR